MRKKLVIKISIIALSTASLISGVLFLYSIAGILDFNKTWIHSMILSVIYFLFAFYLVGFKGYLKEFVNVK